MGSIVITLLIVIGVAYALETVAGWFRDETAPGPIRKAFAQAIEYVRFLSTLGAIVFIVWLTVEVAKSLKFHTVETVDGTLALTVTLESALPLALLTAVLTALLGVLGGLITGPNPLSVALSEAFSVIRQGPQGRVAGATE
ncbi:MAG: hypothetical protein OXG79_12465 [Chloroflexi bacterium]|nr:hypothetical protein [Chloroflexota bacterium]